MFTFAGVVQCAKHYMMGDDVECSIANMKQTKNVLINEK